MICAYDCEKTPQEIRKMWDDGKLNPDGNYSDFYTHVVGEIHHYKHKISDSASGSWGNLPTQTWINDTLGIKYVMTMFTGSHFEVLDDTLTPTFVTKSMEELERFFSDV